MTLAKAPYGKRILAWLVDTLCMSALAGVVIGLGVAAAFSDAVRPAGIALLLASPLVVLGFSLWNTVFRQGRTGQTIGKSLMGTKLVSTDTGAPIGAGSAFVRGLVVWALNLVTVGLFSLVDLLFPAFDRNGQPLPRRSPHPPHRRRRCTTDLWWSGAVHHVPHEVLDH
jgi:uncharacterized RDD family membrane protein YckC